jgi:hypothetical protein
MTRDLPVVQIPLLEKVLRTIAVYLFLVLALHPAGKRELGVGQQQHHHQVEAIELGRVEERSRTVGFAPAGGGL